MKHGKYEVRNTKYEAGDGAEVPAELRATNTAENSHFVLMPARVRRTSYLAYIAYPSSLVLRSANAVQTFSTARELREQDATTAVLIPRWAKRESAFAMIGAHHLLRLPFNVFSHLWRTTAWSYLERSWFAFRAAVWLARRRGAAPTVVYVRDAICAAWFGAGLARLVGARLIYECHALEAWNPSRARSPFACPLVRLIDSLAIRRADRVVTLTEGFREWLDRVGLRSLAATATIPDAYDDSCWFPRDQVAARDMIGLTPTAFVVTYAGLTWAYRGLDRLVRAFAALQATVPESVLVLVGGRPVERAEMAALAEELGIAGKVRLTGQRPQAEVVGWVAAADALVVPGVINGLNASPLKMFEYAAMERPIVADDIPAVREILGDDGAQYFAAGDVVALQAALVAIHRDPAKAAAMAARVRERVAAFTYRARAAAILELAATVQTTAREGNRRGTEKR
ncbi:MAG TPA: glycosyltransferase [Thermomicrobiales bacterium]|jgi:glycosyltransferase involved in cell wall biosynthesis